MDYSRCLGLAAVGFMVKFVQSGQSKRRTSRANKLRRIFLSKMKKLWVYRWTSEGTDVSFERQSKMSTAPINSVTINCGLSGEINKTNTYIHTYDIFRYCTSCPGEYTDTLYMVGLGEKVKPS